MSIILRRITLLAALFAITVLISLVSAQTTSNPDMVSIPGSFQDELGCPGDWQPECAITQLVYDPDDDVWQGSFDLPAGDYEYKVAINGTWDENYGANAQAGGANIKLSLAEDTRVSFFYDHKTHWVTDDVNSLILTIAGSFQSELGCPGDWQPDCLRSWLQNEDGNRVYNFSTMALPAGEYEAKVAVNQSWDENYGANGERNGPNIPFTVPVDGLEVVFAYIPRNNLLNIQVIDPEALAAAAEREASASAAIPAPRVALSQPETVTIPGTIQSKVGCGGDWDPSCAKTFLMFDPADNIWKGSFDIPAGAYEYKVAINGTWGENYGGFADRDGPNVPLNLTQDQTVKFYYDHATHWVADSVGDIIATAPGSYQAAIGCPGDWQPACFRSWLQDPDGDGIYMFVTGDIPAGNYEVKVALNESWDVNYGADGVPGGANIPFGVPADGTLVVFIYNPSTNILAVGVGTMPDVGAAVKPADLSKAQAHWVTADTIAWQLDEVAEDMTFKLYYSAQGGMQAGPGGVIGGSSIDLTYDPAGLSDATLAQFPHLQGFSALKINPEGQPIVPGILKGQMAIASFAGDGKFLTATSLQIPGVLDDLYFYDGPLGVTYDGDVPTLRVWAPTAQSVKLRLFDDSNPDTKASVMNMTLDRSTGVWSITGEPSWTYKYYLYEVKVYAPSTGIVETNRVTDPYAFSLSMNSQRSQILDLNDPALMPVDWHNSVKPPLEAPEDIVVYELHIRDFSVFDATVPEAYRGTYMAFTVPDSNGMQHLRALADAGLTHLHLLPSFDIATINENPAERQEPDYEMLASLPGDSEEQQKLLSPLRDLDAFNWGYDPFHYTVPEGSYATDPDGYARIIEFRSMVQALNASGLRVVIDVVYNHTNSSGQNDKSVLDRIVPGYYHRLNKDGRVETSTCCQNTATEHLMMEKLMIDSVVTWAKHYKIDAFRFDLMGHHMLDNMWNVRQALDALTIENDGVDGKQIFVYGEGWNFGEVANNQRGVNATQLNVGGLGIGTFNDRLRDAVRGGNPFGDRQFQGFINGIYTAPNGITPGKPEDQLAKALLFADQIKVGIAGNLRDYTFTNSSGVVVTGAEVDYNGSPAGYTLDPQENIVYISKHDNETLWDIIQYKDLPGVTIEDLVRIQNLGNSIVLLSQGVPFFQAGDDMLRSKSLDRNSYNSGDWFNKLDFTYETNNWAVGLPPEQDNRDQYPVMRALLAKEGMTPSKDNIMSAVMHFREFLQIRNSSPLFRLNTAEQIQERLVFHDEQQPGVIVYSLSDIEGDDLDPNHEFVVVLFNATDAEITFTNSDLTGMGLVLHPVLLNSHDPVVQDAAFDSTNGAFTIPARTTAVFVLPQS